MSEIFNLQTKFTVKEFCVDKFPNYLSYSDFKLDSFNVQVFLLETGEEESSAME